MFKKALKIKSNTQTKASERKLFKELLQKTFPTLTEEKINEFIPKKESVNCLKVITADNIIIQVYSVQKQPIIFDIRGQIFPTIFLLWRFPYLVYSFTTHEDVLKYIFSGADLMLPGVVTPPNHTGLPRYGNVSENEVVSVTLTNNAAAVAVGLANQDSHSMQLANGRGKCVNIYHFYGDSLCTLEGTSLPSLPQHGAPHWLRFNSNDFPELGCKQETEESEICINQDILNKQELTMQEEQLIDSETLDDSEDMDELLMFCFLGAIKYSKSLTLPALVSNFFKMHMLPLSPPNRTLDIKKTSFKKLKPFLEKMAQEGIISIKEIKKGVEAIVSVNKNHPKFAEFYIDPVDRPRPEQQSNEMESSQKRDIVESYMITKNVLPIFEKNGLKKGDIVQKPDIRRIVTNYIKDNNFQDDSNSRLIKPKESLITICKTESPITWEEVFEKVCENMKNCYKIKSGHEEMFNKGKVSPIVISVAVRSGNKKVTLIDNLELFGININEFSKECQHGVAASTSINKPPGKKVDQLLVQGNQVLFVYNLLVEKYKIPKQYVKGLENAPKKKK